MTALRSLASAAATTIYDAINAAAAPDQLDRLARVMWQGYGEGAISEDDATFLNSCINRRRPLGRASASGHLRQAGKIFARTANRMGSRFTPRQRPRSPDRKASRDRRRMLGGSSALPDDLRHHYTEGQRSVLCIVAGEVKHHGICDLPIDKIAALASVYRTTVQTTMREAHRLHHIGITERPRPSQKSLPNLVEIVSPEWRSWIRRAPSATRLMGSNSVKMVSTTKNQIKIDDGVHEDARERGKESGSPSKQAIEIAAELAIIAGHILSRLPRSWQEAYPERIVHDWLNDLHRVGVGPHWLQTIAKEVMRKKPDKRPPHSIRCFAHEIDKIVKRCADDLATIAAHRQNRAA
jgi:hypothetical protein